MGSNNSIVDILGGPMREKMDNFYSGWFFPTTVCTNVICDLHSFVVILFRIGKLDHSNQIYWKFVSAGSE